MSLIQTFRSWLHFLIWSNIEKSRHTCSETSTKTSSKVRATGLKLFSVIWINHTFTLLLSNYRELKSDGKHKYPPHYSVNKYLFNPTMHKEWCSMLILIREKVTYSLKKIQKHLSYRKLTHFPSSQFFKFPQTLVRD